ncbi:hypothetical protein C8R48DRAFT_719684 [Suillus tomentosus]|nr:hypothetical protein C8R48DRAFT_719684 [Suillus tomentosus]
MAMSLFGLSLFILVIPPFSGLSLRIQLWRPAQRVFNYLNIMTYMIHSTCNCVSTLRQRVPSRNPQLPYNCPHDLLCNCSQNLRERQSHAAVKRVTRDRINRSEYPSQGCP